MSLVSAIWIAVTAAGLAVAQPGDDLLEGATHQLVTPEEMQRALEAGESLKLEPVDVRAAIGSVRSGRAEELGRSAYAFCHDDDYEPPAGVDGLAFCATFDDSTLEVCPQAKGLCVSEEGWTWPDWKLPKIGGLDLRQIFSLLLIAAVLAIIVVVVRRLRGEGWQATGALDLDDLAASPTEAIQSLPKAPAALILRRARSSMDAGEPERAAKLVQLALLRYFDDTGLARFHPSRTNNDYLRSLKAQPDLARLYRAVATQTDRARFGDGRADPERVRAAVEWAERSVRNPASLRPVNVVAGLALALLPLGAGCSGCGESSKPFYSHAPDGMAAVPALLRHAGLVVDIERVTFDDVPEDAGVVLLTTSAAGFTRWADLPIDGLLDRGIALVILDDSGEAERFLPVTLTSTATAELRPAVSLALADEVLCNVDLPALDSSLPAGGAKIPAGRTMTATAATEHRVSMAPVLLHRHRPEQVVAYAAARVADDGTELPGCLFVFSGPDLFTNASLTREANAKLVVGFVASLLNLGERVVILDRIDPRNTQDSVARTIGEARLLPLIAHAGVWLVALFIAAGAAFGPLRDPARRQHKAFVEHVEAVGRHWSAAGPVGHRYAARILARRVVTQHRHAVRGGAGGWAALAKHLATKHDLDERDVRAALRLGAEATTELGPPGAGDADPASERMLRTLSTLNTGLAPKQR